MCKRSLLPTHAYFGLLLFVLIALAACGGAAEEPTPTVDVEPTPAVATDEPTAEPTEAPTEEPTEAPTATAEIEPTEAPPTAEATAEMEPDEEALIQYAGIAFNYGDLASNVPAEEVPASTAGPSGPYWANYPAHPAFSFEGYPLENTFHSPRLEVYPAAQYASLNAFAGEQIEQLQTLLTEQPAELPEQLPFIPLFNAGQVFHAQEAYVRFQNGRGIRYLTLYAQDLAPISNEGVFYTFQGLTDDGAYYVSAILPVSNPELPADYAAGVGDDYEAFADNYQAYLDAAVADLNTFTPDSFTPSLAALDAMIMSLRVMPEPSPRAADAPLTIELPVDGGQVFVGKGLQVRGYVAEGESQTVVLELRTGTNTLVSQTVTSEAGGDWSAVLTVPTNVIGRAQFSASTETETATATVDLLENFRAEEPAENETSISLFRPVVGERAVAGFPLFFEGSVTNPIDDQITIGVLVDACTQFEAQQSFTIEGGAWTGFVILPEGIETEAACAVAYTGPYGEGNWQEVQRLLPIVSPEDEFAPRFALGNALDEGVEAGGTAELFGSAVAAPEGEVRVRLMTPADQTVLVEEITPVDDFGLWEITLPIPEDAPEFLLVTLDFGENAEDDAFLQTGLTINR